MNQTEAYELVSLYLTKFAMTTEVINMHFYGFKWTHLITIPALIFGWCNSLALRSINETLGKTITNSAIFGNNTCFLQ